MKKTLSFILVALLALGAWSALAEQEDVLGQWYLTELVIGDTPVSPAVMDMDVTLILSEDGQAAMLSQQEEETETTEGTYTFDGDTLTLTETGGDEEVLTFTLEEGFLTCENGDITMIFGREPVEALRVPEPIDAQGEADFLGVWTLDQIGVDGSLVPAGVFGIEMTMTIDEGLISIQSGEDDLGTETSAFENGALISTEDETEATSTYTLCDDGSLRCVDDAEGEDGMTLYFVRAE